MRRSRVIVALLLVAVIGVSTPLVASASGRHGQLRDVRRATAQFRDLDVATGAGYGVLLDAKGIACIDMPGMGAMGVHYVNGDLVGDDVLEPTTPEALVYEPDDDGHMRLVAVEYVVFRSAWDATHTSPPSLFGRAFDVSDAGNRFGLPAFYSLHAWVWRHNPAGTFAMFNPKVSCDDEHRHGGGDGGPHHDE